MQHLGTRTQFSEINIGDQQSRKEITAYFFNRTYGQAFALRLFDEAVSKLSKLLQHSYGNKIMEVLLCARMDSVIKLFTYSEGMSNKHVIMFN